MSFIFYKLKAFEGNLFGQFYSFRNSPVEKMRYNTFRFINEVVLLFLRETYRARLHKGLPYRMEKENRI